MIDSRSTNAVFDMKADAPASRDASLASRSPTAVNIITLSRGFASHDFALEWSRRLMAFSIPEYSSARRTRGLVDNQIYDTDRIMFTRPFLTQLQRATAQAVPVKGYF